VLYVAYSYVLIATYVDYTLLPLYTDAHAL
jgi:hypothetical protein